MTSLDRLVAEAATLAGGDHPCSVLGHKWVFMGGANCGCEDGGCSVPVCECEACGDCDYGDSEDADQVRTECRERHMQNPGDAEAQEGGNGR